MSEYWKEIIEFPGYDVSNEGRVRNSRTDRIMTQNRNQQGIPYVGFFKDHVQYKRSVSLLVAEAFKPDHDEFFDTPINLDGDRTNNHAHNIAWRPRWFAIEYRRQLNGLAASRMVHFEHTQTKEVFYRLGDAAVWFGLLVDDVVASIETGRATWPFGDQFKLVD